MGCARPLAEVPPFWQLLLAVGSRTAYRGRPQARQPIAWRLAASGQSLRSRAILAYSANGQSWVGNRGIASSAISSAFAHSCCLRRSLIAPSYPNRSSGKRSRTTAQRLILIAWFAASSTTLSRALRAFLGEAGGHG